MQLITVPALKRRVQRSRFFVSLILLLGATLNATGQSNRSPAQRPDKMPGPAAMCDAARPKLRNSGTGEVALILAVNTSGKVESFRTESPKGLRLERSKDVTAVIKALTFEPAKKDGQPVRVMVRVAFDCSLPVVESK
jgi:outer membrane biosynthesis protein TonB